MAWTTEIFESIHQIDPVEWDCLVKGQPFANWLWFHLTEAVLLNHQPRYVLLRENGKLRAGIASALQKQFQSPLFQATFGWFIRRFPGLRCCVPLSCDPGVFLSEQSSSAALSPILMQGLEHLIQRERISYHTIDHLAPGLPLWASLQARGYHRIAHLEEIYLDIQWASFDDYLNGLTSKKRVEYRRVRRHLEAKDIVVAAIDFSTENELLLQRLVNNVFRHHGEPNLYTRDLFSQSSLMLAEDFKLIVAHQSGQLIGCMALLRSGDEWLVKWPGLDYERTLNTGTYYVLLAESIRYAIQAGGRRIRLGATAYQTKQHFGAIREDRIGGLAFRNRFIHYLGSRVLRVAAGFGISWPIAEAAKYNAQGSKK